MALWQPANPPPKVPADKADLEGPGNLMQASGGAGGEVARLERGGCRPSAVRDRRRGAQPGHWSPLQTLCMPLPPTHSPAPALLRLSFRLPQKGMESPAVAFLCLAGAAWCLGQAALAGGQQWGAYLKLLEESRFINVM